MGYDLEKPKFKSPNGKWVTRALFTNYQSPSRDYAEDYVMYTLQASDENGYPSLKRLYFECDDPTEYTFAYAHLGGWEHWKQLSTETFFKPYIESWREELSIKHQSLALAKLRQTAHGENKLSYDANKYLLEKGWDKPDTRRAKQGRRSKELISEEAEKLLAKSSNEVSQITNDYKRLMSN